METTEENIIWKTDQRRSTEYDIARNVELRFDEISECIELRVTADPEMDDQVSLPKILDPFEAIDLGVALIDAARNQLKFEEER